MYVALAAAAATKLCNPNAIVGAFHTRVRTRGHSHRRTDKGARLPKEISSINNVICCAIADFSCLEVVHNLVLESVFGGELQNPWSCIAQDLAKRVVLQVVVRIVEIWMVQQVEELKANL